MLLEISGTFFGGSVKHLFFLQCNASSVRMSVTSVAGLSPHFTPIRFNTPSRLCFTKPTIFRLAKNFR
jgi:hypothetical protein